MCYKIEATLEYTRPAETVFDIIFTINILVTLITANTSQKIKEDTDISLVFKESILTYLKYIIFKPAYYIDRYS
jgi:hypothetical protein